MTKVKFTHQIKALPDKRIQWIPYAVSPTPVSRRGVGLPARLAAGRLRHEDVGAQRRLGRQGASVQVSNEVGRGHSKMMSAIFDPFPALSEPIGMQPPFFGHWVPLLLSPDVI